MYVELISDKIRLVGWAGKDTPAKCKRVGAGRFKAESLDAPAHWAYPVDLATCRSLRREFPALEIGPELNKWAKSAVASEKRQAALQSAVSADLVRVPDAAPFLYAATATRPYQRTAAAWGSVTGSFLNADEQGLGKTIETLATIIESSTFPQWHLIFCPSVAVTSVWAPEVLRWLRDRKIEVLPLVGTLAEREAALGSFDVPYETEHVFVVANIESARIKPHYPDPDNKKKVQYLAENAVLPALHQRVWDTIVVDECQRALIRTTGTKTQARAGFELLSRNSERRIALSGTPMRGKPEQLWGTLNWLRPDVYTSYWNWVKKYFHLESNGFSNYILGDWLDGGQERLAEDLRSIMIRRTKAEVLTELPPKTYAGALLDPADDRSPIGIWLDPLPAQRKQLAQLERDSLLEFEGGEEVLVDGVLATYTRQKQIANAAHKLIAGKLVPTLESPKFEWLKDFIAELDGAKVVVASQFTQIVDAFAAGLREEGVTVSVLTGKTSQKARTSMVTQFQETDEVQVFFLNTKAGGVALTLDAADYVVLVDETTVPDDQVQVEDRTHRASRNHNVVVYYLRTLGTLDEEICWVSAARANVGQYLLDGARGVEFARALYQQSKEDDHA